MSDQTNEWQNWLNAASAAEVFEQSLPELRMDRAATLSAARRALANVETRREALFIIGSLSTDFTSPLVDDLLDIALSDRDTLRVRNLLGRLPHAEAGDIIPEAVGRLLHKEDDGYAYRRMAELLHHLGLAVALQTLCEQARDHIDAEVREVDQDFRFSLG
ncbi:hypothetical protein OG782_35245 [Streptomyces sp. NBC_00876]|uniref:hypothetical protein n=1 Tax=Streptomyces sp. NBC_00876 TaxID=2975853 RepID=UPI003868258A|nr:hypothetical protein OG782_35245 [Streptomyces sp. NBC_00876]